MTQPLRRLTRPALLTLVLAGLPAFATGSEDADRQPGDGLQPSDFYFEKIVQGAELSPDGRWLAYTVMSIVEDENKRHREIWMAELDGTRVVSEPVRFSAPTEESSGPRWSPDGKLLAFSSRRGDDENGTWFLRVGGPGGEAFHVDGVEGSPIWSPDGRFIAFTKSVDPDETDDGEEEGESEEKKKPDNEREGWISPSARSKTLDAKRFDGRVITSMRYKRDGRLPLQPDPSVRDLRQLFVVPAEGGEATQITDLAFDVGGVEWLPDASGIYFTGDPMQADELNRELTSEMWLQRLDARGKASGDPVLLTENPGSERSAAVSPSGDRMAYLRSPARGEQTDLFVVDLAKDGTFAGEPRNLTANWDYQPGSPEWRPDGQALRFSTRLYGNSHLYELDPTAKEPEVTRLTSGDRNLGSFSSSDDGSVLAYTATDPLNPSDLFVAAGDASGEQRVTRLNEDWLAERTLAPVERLTWKVKDGTEVEGWLIPPVGFERGKAASYPMVLKIHGGPHSAYGNYWFRTFHVLSASGMFVLYTNPRGSSGYGHGFTYATRGKWGELDSEDYLTGVDEALSRYSEIDPRRVGVSGGSYGGFMTNWLTATTDRFAAAVTSRSITNWESWYGTSDAQGLTEHEFYGPPWEQRELYRRLSPITYVENVTAPTLIIHSENDWRTPIGDGEQWFMALRKREVPVELVRYPRSSHGLSRTGEPWLLVDRLERLRSWFVHYLVEETDL